MESISADFKWSASLIRIPLSTIGRIIWEPRDSSEAPPDWSKLPSNRPVSVKLKPCYSKVGRKPSDSSIKMFLSLLLVLLSFLAATLCSQAEPVPIPQIVAMAKPCVIQIVAFDEHWQPIKTGTGFFISNDGLLLTNYHVIDGATSLGGRTAQGAIFVLEQIVAVSRDQDLALLKFQGTRHPFPQTRELCKLSRRRKGASHR
jgi:S1-C subfamily serine protease